MKTSDNGRRFIEKFEGLILQAYDDADDHIVQPREHVHGTLTIGYGHTDAAGPPHVYAGQTITEQEADAILASDLASVEAEVNHLVTVPLTQNQFDALISFHFNTGGLGRSSVLRDINNGQLNRVAADLNLWVKSGGVVMRGLVRRRQAEGVLFNTPQEATNVYQS